MGKSEIRWRWLELDRNLSDDDQSENNENLILNQNDTQKMPMMSFKYPLLIPRKAT